MSRDASGVSRAIIAAPQVGWDEPTQAALQSVLRKVTVGEDQRASSRQSGSSVWSLGLIAYLGLFLVVGAIVMFVPGRAATVGGASLLGLGGLALWVLSRNSGSFAGTDVRLQLVTAWLGERRCPSCAYPLNTELTGTQRGLWRCSECGGIWSPVVENGPGRGAP